MHIITKSSYQISFNKYHIIKIGQKQPPEVFFKALFLKILQVSQESTCVSLFSTLLKILLKLFSTLLKKRLRHRCFPVYFESFLRTPFMQNTSGPRQLLLISNNRNNYCTYVVAENLMRTIT